jgi:prepilin-type N-terminal cleavage/methylation domain-containing protein
MYRLLQQTLLTILDARREVARGRATRRGMTLVELMVVLMIIVIMMGVALPLMRTTVDESRVREGARQLQAFIAVAKATATETGRDCGIWIERSANDANAAFEVYLAERPRPYAGDVMNAKAELMNHPAPNRGIAVFLLSEVGSMSPSAIRPIVQAGDLIRFGYKGPYYKILSAPVLGPQITIGTMTSVQTVTLEFTWQVPHPAPLPILGSLSGTLTKFGSVPFQIIRAPQKSNARILQLTNGIAIDLQHSGIGYGRYSQFDLIRGRANASPAPGSTITPVIIMFAPSGNVSEVFYWDVSGELLTPPQSPTFLSVKPSETIGLLVGRVDGREQVEDSVEFPNPIDWAWNDNTQSSYSKNLTSFSSNWVTIHPRNGTVTTGLNGFQLSPGGGPYLRDTLQLAREYAERGQQSGGG